MRGACSTYGVGRGVYRGLVGNPEGKSHLEDPDADGRVILRWISGSGMGHMDWIDLAQDRDRWRALMNAVTNLRGP
jgi:hypothetical protein